MDKISFPIIKKVKINPRIHSELHEFIDETRKEWNDLANFGYWLGRTKDIPMSTLYQIRASIRESNAKTPAKLFFWKIKELNKPKPVLKRVIPRYSVDNKITFD